jgi:hypothetical protein
MTGSFYLYGPFAYLVRHRADQPSAIMSGVPTMPLSRSADIVARVLSQAFTVAPVRV